LWFLGIITERRHRPIAQDNRQFTGYSISGPRDLGSRRWIVGWFPDEAAPGTLPSLSWPE
jgi:hypothetical protein